jgi:lipopolysaccharide export system protein LptA
MLMYCDSAVFNKTENRFSAFGVINIFIDDTIHLSGDELYYDGNIKVAELMGKKVLLEDGKMTLLTDYLVLERIPNIVRYTNSAKIWDDKNVIRSQQATYYMNEKSFDFVDKVNIETPNSNIVSDTIHYNTRTDIAIFEGPTTIINTDSTKIYTESGSYNTTTEYCESFKATQMTQKGRLMHSDTLFFDSKTKNGESFGNVYLEDSTNHINAFGNYARMSTIDILSNTYLTGDALVKQLQDKDTLYLHADTLCVVSDTAMVAQDIFAYKHAKLYRIDLQGAAELAHYSIKDSLLTMVERPILWNEENQLTADTINVLFAEKKISQMILYPNALMVQNADTTSEERFNQAYGRKLMIYFSNGKINIAEIDGNAESIYYMWEESKGKTPRLIGINIGNSAKTKIYFEKSKIKRLVGIENPEFYLDN